MEIVPLSLMDAAKITAFRGATFQRRGWPGGLGVSVGGWSLCESSGGSLGVKSLRWPGE